MVYGNLNRLKIIYRFREKPYRRFISKAKVISSI